jgi:hypothetical protein
MKERRQEGTLHHVSHTHPIYVNITEGPEGTSGYHIGTDINVSEDLRGSLEKRHANGKSSALPSDTYLLFPMNPDRFATIMLEIPIPQLWELEVAVSTCDSREGSCDRVPRLTSELQYPDLLRNISAFYASHNKGNMFERYVD